MSDDNTDNNTSGPFMNMGSTKGVEAKPVDKPADKEPEDNSVEGRLSRIERRINFMFPPPEKPEDDKPKA